MRLVASGSPLESVPFGRNLELVTGAALIARRHVASSLTPETIASLRRKRPSDSRDWTLLQSSLFAAGLRVCPVSGTPICDVDGCSPELREAMWAGLVAIADASQGDTSSFERAMANLSELVVRVHVEPEVVALGREDPTRVHGSPRRGNLKRVRSDQPRG